MTHLLCVTAGAVLRPVPLANAYGAEFDARRSPELRRLARPFDAMVPTVAGDDRALGAGCAIGRHWRWVARARHRPTNDRNP